MHPNATFRHMSCFGTSIKASLCEACGKVIAWGPTIGSLKVAELAHELFHSNRDRNAVGNRPDSHA